MEVPRNVGGKYHDIVCPFAASCLSSQVICDCLECIEILPGGGRRYRLFLDKEMEMLKNSVQSLRPHGEEAVYERCVGTSKVTGYTNCKRKTRTLHCRVHCFLYVFCDIPKKGNQGS